MTTEFWMNVYQGLHPVYENVNREMFDDRNRCIESAASLRHHIPNLWPAYRLRIIPKAEVFASGE